MDRTQPLDLQRMELDNKQLHKHQIEATDAMDKYFNLLGANRGSESGLLVMPTGSGKTFTAVNWLLDRAVANGYKIIWFVHRQELVDQADYTFRKQAPLLLSHGKSKLRVLPISGGHFSMSMASRYDIYVCCIASAASKNGMRYIRRMMGEAGKEKLVVVVDEAHHAVSPSYQKVIKKITEINPNRILLGLTATPTRMQEYEKIKLFKTFEADKNGFVYQVSLKELLANGFLAQPIYKRVETKINGEVEFNITPEDEAYYEKFGELSERILEQLAKSSFRNEVIVKEYIANRKKYGKTLVFAVNRLHAVTLKKAFEDKEVVCDYCISGEPGTQEKIRAFKEGKYEVLINVQILTEGSDVPDIQTIFLTRQTNSDSLLMQMIGRGLRGEDAGGTKFAYIVDFHDTWEKFNFWLDPKKLLEVEFGDIIEDEPKGEVIGSEEDIDENADHEEKNELGPKVNLWDLYLKIYGSMKSNAMGLSNKEIFPHGWYSVVDENGEDTKVLVFDNQLQGYNEIEANTDELLNGKPEAQRVIKDYFDCETNLPKSDEMQLILDTLYEVEEMPPYYTFIERDMVDPKKIAKNLIEMDLKRSEEEYYLKNKYDSTPIIRELYKNFYMFKKSIEQAIITITEGTSDTEIISIDEREEFNIIENYYDLNKLLKEVVDEARSKNWFSVEVLPEIRWSRKPLLTYYGLCTSYEDGSYSITVNKLLSSPNVPVETVKYLIYHELLHAAGYWNHDKKFREQEWKYPNSEEHDGVLNELFIRYHMEKIVLPSTRKAY